MNRMIVIAVVLAGMCLAGNAAAQQHDHQDWNLLSIGRVVTFARTDSCVRDRKHLFTCAVDASDLAMTKMEELLATFDCTSYSEDTVPKISQANPFTRHDHGPVIVADMENVRCKTLPSTQLMPVEPVEFKKYCSRLEWKCDAVWVPDSDPSVWYIGVIADIPPLIQQ
jgi:hypothetical protein